MSAVDSHKRYFKKKLHPFLFVTVDINFASKRLCPFFYLFFFVVSFSFTFAVDIDQIGPSERTVSFIQYDTTSLD